MQQFFELKKLKLFNRIRLNNIAIDMPHYIIHHRLAHSNGNQNKLAMTANLTQPIVRPFGNSFFHPQSHSGMHYHTVFNAKTLKQSFHVKPGNISGQVL